MLTYLNIGSLLGRWIPGFIADKIGIFNMHILAMSLCAVSALGIWLPSDRSLALLVTFAVCFGFGSGCGIALVPVCIARLCKIEEYGHVYSAVHTVSSIGYVFMISNVVSLCYLDFDTNEIMCRALVGIPIAGQIIEATHGDYWGLIIFAGMAYVAGLICFLIVRTMSVGLSIVKKY
jgi:MFS family permease